MKNSILLLAGIALLAISNVATADLVLTVDSTTTLAGNMASVSFFAADSDGATGGVAALAGFNLPLDLGGDGIGIPAGLTFSSIATGADFAPSGTAAYTNSPGVAPFNWDGGVGYSSTSGAIALDSTPTELFTLNFLVDGSVTAGTVFDISVVNPPTPNAASLAFSGSNLGDPVNTPGAIGSGSITVAVPEPSGLILLVASIAGIATRRRRG